MLQTALLNCSINEKRLYEYISKHWYEDHEFPVIINLPRGCGKTKFIKKMLTPGDFYFGNQKLTRCDFDTVQGIRNYDTHPDNIYQNLSDICSAKGIRVRYSTLWIDDTPFDNLEDICNHNRIVDSLINEGIRTVWLRTPNNQ